MTTFDLWPNFIESKGGTVAIFGDNTALAGDDGDTSYVQLPRGGGVYLDFDPYTDFDPNDLTQSVTVEMVLTCKSSGMPTDPTVDFVWYYPGTGEFQAGAAGTPQINSTDYTEIVVNLIASSFEDLNQLLQNIYDGTWITRYVGGPSDGQIATGTQIWNSRIDTGNPSFVDITEMHLHVTIIPPVNAAFITTVEDDGLSVSLDASPSGEGVVNYAWDFGDGTTLETNSATADHTYENPGTYTITLTVTGADDVTATTAQDVEVTEVEVPNITGLAGLPRTKFFPA